MNTFKIKLVSLLLNIENYPKIKVEQLCSNNNPNIRVKGAASMLLKTLLDFIANNHKIATVYLYVAKCEENAAVKFYTRMGFVENDTKSCEMIWRPGGQEGGSKRVFWSRMTHTEIKLLAKEYGIHHKRNMSRDDLIKVIKNKRIALTHQ